MRKREKIKLILAVVVLAGLTVVVLLFVRRLNAPAEGIVSTAASIPTEKNKSVMTKLVTAKGKTATFQHPDSLRRTTPEKLSPQDVEKFSFLKPALPSWDLNIQIRKLPSGSLADDGSYNLRAHYPDKYQATKLAVNGQSVPIMAEQSGGFAKVAFLTHQGLAAEISLSSGSTSDSAKLDAALMTVLQTWHWL